VLLFSERRLVTPDAALARLAQGNLHFVHELTSARARTTATREWRARLAEGQEPFATVVTCSDSRVPAELVFDQGLGDLFIVRNAGNVLGHAPLASVEFGVAKLGTPLVVVMGHERCGAFRAADEAIRGVEAAPTESLEELVKRLRPSLTAAGDAGTDEQRRDRAIRLHARVVAEAIAASVVVAPLVVRGALWVVPAYYSLAEGKVEFSERVAAPPGKRDTSG
jgi:carbonic anhydrase